MQLPEIPDADFSAEWSARCDLAAAHRLAVQHQLNDGINNHLTLVLPHAPHLFLSVPFGMMWSEVTASSLAVFDFDGNLVRGSGQIQKSALCIHAPIHERMPRAKCVMHTHMPYATALTRLEHWELLPTGQDEAFLGMMAAYDHDYLGLAHDHEEGHRLASVLGDKQILFMANHGVLVIGESVAQAYDRLLGLERACRLQLYAMWTGRPLKVLSDHTLDLMRSQLGNPQIHNGPAGFGRQAELQFAGFTRRLRRSEPDYLS